MCSQRRKSPVATLLNTSHRCIPYASILCLLLTILPAAAQPVAKTEPPMRLQVMESYGKLPLSFEANQGQTDQRVKFLSRGPGYSLFLTGDSAVLSLRQQKANAVLRMKLLGANAHVSVAGTDGLPGKSNYFVGNDPKQWRTNVPTYAAVKYESVYPGIDLVYHGNQRLLEYDFVVAPGADPRAIDLRFQGARKLSVNGEGALVIGVGGSEVIEHAPVVYQEIGGVRKTLAGRYVLRSRGRVGFSVAEYDRSRALVIDPTLVYSTYLRSAYDRASAVDTFGNVYVTGYGNFSFLTTPGSFQTSGYGVFVTKLNAAGSALVYSTYVGDGFGQGQAIAVDASGNAYVTGLTYSSSFPTTPGAFQTSFVAGPGQQTHAFVTKLNATGSALLYSAYLGGSSPDSGLGIAVDVLGDAYVTGETSSHDFPTTPGSFQTSYAGGAYDAFASKLNAAGSSLVYSTYLGGSGYESGIGIAVDGWGNAYVGGDTSSFNFPTTPGALQTNGRYFVTKLNATGTAPVYSTYLGDGSSIAVDASGNAYVGGSFVSKLDAAGSALVYSFFLGGAYSRAIAIDASGNAYVAGQASSSFPATPGAFQTTLSGRQDGFVSKLSAAGALLYATYLGGAGDDTPNGIAVDSLGNIYVAGVTDSPNFPTTPGALQTTYGGSCCDAFVTKLSIGTPVTPPQRRQTSAAPRATTPGISAL